MTASAEDIAGSERLLTQYPHACTRTLALARTTPGCLFVHVAHVFATGAGHENHLLALDGISVTNADAAVRMYTHYLADPRVKNAAAPAVAARLLAEALVDARTRSALITVVGLVSAIAPPLYGLAFTLLRRDPQQIRNIVHLEHPPRGD